MTPAEEDAFVARYLDHDPEGRPNGFAKIMTDEDFRLAIRAAVAQERERCAKYIEECSLPDVYSEPCLAEFAADIRRGE